VRRALATLFNGAIGKDVVSRVWRKVQGDWQAWNHRSLAEEPIIRLILDGTVARVKLAWKAKSIALLVVLGIREDGQKVLLAVKRMGGETAEAWRSVLDDLVRRGSRKPELLIVDGGAGLEAALAAIWGDVPTQRCTVHKHRNLLANAPERLHDEIAADYNGMIYADTPESGAKPSCASGGCATPPSPTASKEPAIASSLSQHWPPSQWKKRTNHQRHRAAADHHAES
jgi:putative transposase